MLLSTSPTSRVADAVAAAVTRSALSGAYHCHGCTHTFNDIVAVSLTVLEKESDLRATLRCSYEESRPKPLEASQKTADTLLTCFGHHARGDLSQAPLPDVMCVMLAIVI